MNTPLDVATQETVAFLTEWLPDGGRVLEVGCGAGHVAAELGRRGYEVIGIEANDKAVAAAREIGVEAVHATWMDYDPADLQVDAVVFTRSLHHLHPLEEAVARARDLGDLLLIEDIAFEDVGETALQWFCDMLRSPAAAKLLVPAPGELATELLEADDPLEAWQKIHDHDLHSFESMTRTIERHFLVQETRQVPYLYRHLLPVLPETREAADLVQHVLHEEKMLAARPGGVVGRRLVATLPAAA